MRLAVWICAGILTGGLFAQDRGPLAATQAPKRGAVLFLPAGEFRALETAARAQLGLGPRSVLLSSAIMLDLTTSGTADLTGTFHYRHSQGLPRTELPLLAARGALDDFRSEPPGGRLVLRTQAGAESVPRLILTSAPETEGRLTLRLSLAVERHGTLFRVVLQPPAARTSLLEVPLPTPDTSVRIEPALQVETLPATAGLPARLRATVQPVPVTVSWGLAGTAAAAPEERPQIVLHRQTDRYVLEEGWLSGHSRFELDVTGAPLPGLTFVLPGSDLADVKAAPGEAAFDSRSGTVTVTFPESVLGRETVSVDFRRKLEPASPRTVGLSPARLAAGVAPQEAWLVVQSASPVDVKVAATAAGLVLPASRVPPDLLPAKDLTTRLAVQYQKPDLVLPLELDFWPSGLPPAAVGEDLTASSVVLDDGTCRSRMRLSVDVQRPCTFAVDFAGPTSCTLDSVSVDGRKVEPGPGSRTPSFTLSFAKATSQAAAVELDSTCNLGLLGWFGRLTVRLPQPRLLVRGVNWRVSPPSGHLFFGFRGDFNSPEAVRPFFLFRFGGEVLDIFWTLVFWAGLPALSIAIVVLWLRQVPLADAISSSAAGVLSVLLLVLVAIGLYAMAVPALRKLIASPDAGLRMDREGLGFYRGLGPEPQAPPASPPGPWASAAPTRGPLDELAPRPPMPAPAPQIVAPALQGPGYRAAGPSAFEAAAPPDLKDPSATEPASLLTLSRLVWLGEAGSGTQGASGAAPGASTTSPGRPQAELSAQTTRPGTPAGLSSAPTTTGPSAAPMEPPRLEATFDFVQRSALPVLQGLSLMLGVCLALLLWLGFAEPDYQGGYAWAAAGCLFVLGAVEGLLPSGMTYGATGFAVPLGLGLLVRMLQWVLSSRFGEGLPGSLSHAAGLGATNPGEVPISDLFGDSDGISFVGDRPAATEEPGKKES